MVGVRSINRGLRNHDVQTRKQERYIQLHSLPSVAALVPSSMVAQPVASHHVVATACELRSCRRSGVRDRSLRLNALVMASLAMGARAVMRLTLFTLLVGCAHVAPVQLPKVLPVAITAWPGRPTIDCMLPDLPDPPVALIQNVEEPIIGRVMVHKREFDELLSWATNVRGWSMEVKECLQKLGVNVW